MASDEYQCCRWLTPDPLGGDITNPQSLNRYAYVLNNPETLTDPSGLDTCYTQNGPVDCPPVIGTSVTVNGGEAPPFWLSLFADFYLNFWPNLPTNFPSPVGHPGGGSVLPPPRPAPPGLRPPSYGQVLKSFNNCAANFADKYSVASLLHLNNSTIGNALLGSTTAAVSNLVFRTNPKVYVPGGTNLAVASKAGAGLKGAAVALGRLETDQGFQSVFTTVAPTTLGQTAAGGAGLSATRAVGEFIDLAAPVLIGYDEAVYGVGEGACTARAF